MVYGNGFNWLHFGMKFPLLFTSVLAVNKLKQSPGWERAVFRPRKLFFTNDRWTIYCFLWLFDEFNVISSSVQLNIHLNFVKMGSNHYYRSIYRDVRFWLLTSMSNIHKILEKNILQIPFVFDIWSGKLMKAINTAFIEYSFIVSSPHLSVPNVK